MNDIIAPTIRAFDAARDPLEIIEVEQNTPDWDGMRAGLVTASEFGTVMAKPKSKSDKESLTRMKYMRTLVTEIVTKTPVEGYQNAAMLRGHVVEEEAARMYEFLKDVDTAPGGFWRRGRVGASPDRRIVDKKKLLEVKSKAPHLMLELLANPRVPPEHRPQTQGQLWVGREVVETTDMIFYWPRLKPLIVTVEPDFAYWREIEDAVGQFLHEMDQMLKWYGSL